jgi:hypothetical protein
MSYTWFCDVCKHVIRGKRFRLEEQAGPLANQLNVTAALDICEDCRNWLLQRRWVDESVV